MTSEWRESTIGAEVLLQRGFDITRAEQRIGYVPVVSSGGISSYHDTAAAKGPGVVLGRKGVVGSVYFVKSDYWPHDTTLWVKDFKGNDPRFVYYFFKGRANQLASLDVGSANPTLNRNHVHPTKTLWPPLPEQKAIAHILGTLDDKIELNRKMNETFEAMARAIFQSWFVDFDPVRAKMESRRPVGMDAKTAELFPDSFVDSELGKIPKGWTVVPCLNVFELLSGGTPKTDEPSYWGGHILWASAKDVSQCSDAFLLSTERRITKAGLANSTTKVMPALSTVVVARGATTGRHVMLARDTAMNQTCYALRCNQQHHNWLYCWFGETVEDLLQAAHGSVFDTITTTTFQKTRLLLPSTPVLALFEARVGTLFSSILASLSRNRTLASIRDALLPKLLSGKLQIPDAERFIKERV